MAKVFLTNASGYIGKAVAKAALQKGHTVTALTRSVESAQKLENIGVKPVHGDLKEPHKYIDAVRQADVVIHTAATNDIDTGKFDTLTVDQKRQASSFRARSNRPFGTVCKIISCV